MNKWTRLAVCFALVVFCGLFTLLATDAGVSIGSAEANGQVLDLSDVAPDQLDAKIEEIKQLGNVDKILLMDENGKSQLSPKDVKKLMDAMPGVFVDYSFELYGKTLSTSDERIEYVKVRIGNEGVEKIREALDILPNCTYFLLDDCGIDNKTMGQLREDYPDTKIVWRIYIINYSVLTDTEMIHCNQVRDQDTEGLHYCNDVMYLDLGHTKYMTDISFISKMPKLKIAIIVDSSPTTLEPFANCPDLERLEIVNCKYITDLSPLKNCTKLKGLNMSSAFGITDITPLYELQNLERLYLGASKITKEQYKEACEKLPNCWITNYAKEYRSVSGNYAVGWRLELDGSKSDWYLEVREIFQYDKPKH